MYKAHYIQYSMEKTVNTMEENPDRNHENLEELLNWRWDVIVVIEKAMKAIKPEIIYPCWRKLYSDVMHDFTGSTTAPIKEIMKEM